MTDEQQAPTPPNPMQPPKLTREQRVHQAQVSQMAGMNEMLTNQSVDLQIANERIAELEQQVQELEAALAPFLATEPQPEKSSPETSPASQNGSQGITGIPTTPVTDPTPMPVELAPNYPGPAKE